MVNSLELAYRLRMITVDSSSSSSSVPPPPDMMSTMSYSSMSSNTQFELDCSRFNSISPSPSFASSVSSFSSSAQYEKRQGGMSGGLSRSRCAHNLSALCSSSSSTEYSTLSSTRQMYESSGPNEGWGYFVDTPKR
mmetsp:Transcript_27196/g.57391  ORF Transcript_27196/g.57391 Transcript_27196/m.57391 type:complete len:136 (-) Transcript_27196:583-990(-)